MATVTRARATAWFLLTKAVELLLVGLGLFLGFAEDENAYLSLTLSWVLVAAAYLGVGAHRTRRSSTRPAIPVTEQPRWQQVLDSRRLHFTFTTVASLVGLGAATVVLAKPEPGADKDLLLAVNLLSILAVMMAWALLHAGYANFYRRLLQGPERGGLDFPQCPEPGPVEFAYFAYTVAVSFAASDVTVISTRMRWHLLVHSIVSFFYNTAVIAVTIGAIGNIF